MSEMVYRFGCWTLGLVGFIPAAQARRAEEFETTLMMLLPSEEERERFREGVLMLAQTGLVDPDQIEILAKTFARYGADTTDQEIERQSNG